MDCRRGGKATQDRRFGHTAIKSLSNQSRRAARRVGVDNLAIRNALRRCGVHDRSIQYSRQHRKERDRTIANRGVADQAVLVIVARVTGALILLPGSPVSRAMALGHLDRAMGLDPHAQRRTGTNGALHEQRERDQPRRRLAEQTGRWSLIMRLPEHVSILAEIRGLWVKRPY